MNIRYVGDITRNYTARQSRWPNPEHLQKDTEIAEIDAIIASSKNMTANNSDSR